MPEVLERRCSEEGSLVFPGSRGPWARECALRSCSITMESLKRVMRSENEDGVDSGEVRNFALAAVEHAHGNKRLNTICHRLYQATIRMTRSLVAV